MSLIFDLRARCICFACVVLTEIIFIIILYQFNKNPFFRMRVQQLLPKGWLERSEIQLVQRDAENGIDGRNDTERELKVHPVSQKQEESDRFDEEKADQLQAEYTKFSVHNKDFSNLIEVIGTPRVRIDESRTEEAIRSSRGIFAELDL